MPFNAPPPWEEVADSVMSGVPESSRENIRRAYEAQRSLMIQRNVESTRESEPASQYVARRAIPFASSIRNFADTNEYRAAMERINHGLDQPEDIANVANYERTQEIDRSRGLLGQVASGLAHVPGLIGESLAGGAVVGRALPAAAEGASLLARGGLWAGRTAAQTAATPAFYLHQAAERAAQQGGEWYNPSNLGPAFGTGLAQTAILGSLPGVANKIAGQGIIPALGRIGARTAVGMGEQQIVDVLGGAVDNIIPEAYQFRTRYGLLGHMLRGEWGELGTQAAVQAATFAAFSALHPVLHGEARRELPAPEQLAAQGPQVGLEAMPPEQRGLVSLREQQTRSLARTPPIEATPSRAETPIDTTATRTKGLLTGPSGELLDAYQRAVNELSAARLGAKKETVAKLQEKAAQKLLAIHDLVLNSADRSPEASDKAIADMKLSKWTEYYAKMLIDTIRPPAKLLDPADAQRILGEINTNEIAGRTTTGPIAPKPPAEVNPLDQFTQARPATPPVPRIEISPPVRPEPSTAPKPTVLPPEGQTGQKLGVPEPLATKLQPQDAAWVKKIVDQSKAAGKSMKETLSQWSGNELIDKFGEEYTRKAYGVTGVSGPVVGERTAKQMFDAHVSDGSVSRAEVNKAADLNPKEAHVFWRRWDAAKAGEKLTHKQIGQETEMRKGTGASVGRAAVQLVEKGAMEKMGFEGMSMAKAVAQSKAEIKSSEGTTKEEVSVGGARQTPEEFAATKYNKSLDNIEAGKAGKMFGSREKDVEFVKKYEKENPQAIREREMVVSMREFDAAKTPEEQLAVKNKWAQHWGTELTNEARELGKSEKEVQRDLESARLIAEANAREDAAGQPETRGESGTRPGTRDVSAEGESKLKKFIKDEGGFIDPEVIARFGVDMLAKITKIAKGLAEPAPRPTISNRSLGRRAELKLPEISIEKAKENAKDFAQRMLGWFESANNELNQLASHSVPILTKLDRLSGEAGHRLAATAEWVRRTVPYMVDKVIGEHAERADRLRNGAGFMETEVRYAKQANREHAAKLRASGKEEEAKAYEAKADAMTTFVGKEVRPGEIPLKTEADYQTWVKSEEAKRFTKEYDEGPAPILIENWKVYKGLAEGDLVESLNQRPGRPVNFMRINSQAEISDTTVFTGGMKKGDLANVKQNRLIYDQTATRAHDAYELDPAKWIPASIVRSTTAKNKVDFYRAMEKAGLAQEGPAKQNVVLPNGDTTWELPNVRGNKSLYVGNKARGEVRQILNVNDPLNAGLITDVAKVLNKAMLTIPIQEGVSHGKNLFTSLFSIGVNPVDMIKNAIGIYRQNPEMMKGLQDLAKIDAAKAPGFESGQLWGGKTDPTAWAAKLLDFIGDSARLTLKDAHDRNVRWNRIADTETNLRDFVNQGAGNYNKATQHRFVLWLRELGIGPFATAATNFYAQGMRMLTLDPGVKATTWAHAAGMRAEILGKMVAVVGSVFAINKAVWGNLFGDDDTPIGAIKTGKTEDGKTTYMDLTALTGLTRGMRASGLLAITEGARQGSSVPRIVDRAMENIIDNLMHPMEGPIVGFAHTLATGRNSIGMQVAQTPPPSGSQFVENVKAAGIQANPITSTLFGQSRQQQDMTWGQKALALMGPYNPFKIHGDSILAEMHGRLREVEDARKVFNADPDNIRRPFPQEGEYQILHQFNQAISQLDQALKGKVRTSVGLRQVAAPELERISQLRERIRDLARRSSVVLESFRQRQAR